MEYWKENEGKRAHDPLFHHSHYKEKDERCVSVLGPIIVGAGPSGLAVSACLKAKGISSLIIERSNCIASLWQLRTYDRLSLHLPKHYCELPLMPFPDNFPTYPTKQQFVGYLESYAKHFGIKPAFGRTVVRAEFDAKVGLWRMRTVAVEKEKEKEVVVEYGSRWLVVATGENAEIVVPEIDGLDDFKGLVMHSSSYKSGVEFSGKKVLVVGCGNSGMEVCLDLCNHNARPLIVVRDKVHVLPREMLGQSTFGLSLWLMKWLPIRLVDQFLLLLSWIKLGDTARLGLIRPNVGPLEFKSISGKTPVLDVGTLAKIKSGDIKVRPAIKRISDHGVEFENGRWDDIYAVIQATGYKSNVPSWLKEKEMFSDKDGLPRRPFPNGWKGERGLYAVGFTKKGLLGTSIDARKIADDIELSWRKVADDIEQSWKAKNKQLIGFSISAIMPCNQNKKIERDS